jgi:hypothetical protein
VKAAAAAVAITLCAAARAFADPVAFDLPGPTLQVDVTRGDRTLPVAEVASLAAGDHIWMKAAFSAGQSVNYLMVAVFLRGSTDPPPKSWFFRCTTWSGKCAKDGMTLTVPAGAQQLVVFLAPETGGDFNTLMDAVRGRPGAFVRTSQELNQAAVEHLRLQTYLAEIRRLGEVDPGRLKDAAPLLSRTLAIKLDERCLQKISAFQAACLVQGQETLIMNDGHGESVTQQLTTGPASDLAMEAINTPQLKSGYYGPFIGSLLDIARLLDSFHTAKYQYIPALATPRGRDLALTLNAPPSFHDPKSVLVAALPPVDSAQAPELRAVDPQATYCLRRKPLVLALEGAPAMFAGASAHDVMLRVMGSGGNAVDLPATPDPAQGGFAVDPGALGAANLGESVRGTLQGFWGFDHFIGPSVTLTDADAGSWTIAPADDASVVVGRQAVVHVQSSNVDCVSDVSLTDSAGKKQNVDWKIVRAGLLEAKLPLDGVGPGNMTLSVGQYGAPPQQLTLHGYAEAGRLDGFAINAGDDRGVLKGNRLDEVEALTLGDVEFVPDTLSINQGAGELSMVEKVGSGPLTVKPGDAAKARARLKDGRAYDVKVAIAAPRPSATLLSRNVQPTSGEHNLRLGSKDEVPQDAVLFFALHASAPASFSRDEKIEVATMDSSTSVILDQASGHVTLQNSRIAVATLDPKAFGPSAYGPLRYRLLAGDVAGDWQPLATLVRLPVLTAVQCEDAGKPCRLSGANLFLLDSVSTDSHFAASVAVPDGFTGDALAVPRPKNGQLFIRLRDDPAAISVASLEVPPAPSPVTAPAPAAPAAPAALGAPGVPAPDVPEPAATPAPLPTAPPTSAPALPERADPAAPAPPPPASVQPASVS